MSTSSSDRRIPDIPYRSLWLQVMALVLLVLTGLEVGLRARGFLPSRTDDLLRWSRERARAEDAGPGTIAILGASRAQMDLSPRVLEETLPGQTVLQLAVSGSHPLPAFHDLARRSRFAGLVLLSYHPAMGCFVSGDQGEQVLYYRDEFSSPGRYQEILGQILESAIQDRLTLFSQQALWTTLIQNRGGRPLVRVDARRFQEASFLGRSDLPSIQEERLDFVRRRLETGRLPTERAVELELREVRRSVVEIRERGGEVLLLALPSSGEHRRIEDEVLERLCPWERLGSLTGARTLSWEEDPRLHFPTPDLSHLDVRHALAFSEALAGILRERGLLQSPPRPEGNAAPPDELPPGPPPGVPPP